MRYRTIRKTVRIESLIILMAACAAAVPGRAAAQLYINEMFFNPGMSVTDDRDEYIEIRGEPGASLANYYLIFVEGDDDLVGQGPAGLIDNVFDLNYNAANPGLGQSLGANGFLSLRQKNSRYAVNPAANNLINQGDGAGWGSGTSGLTASTIGATDELDEGQLENSAFTAMIVRKTGDLVPAVGIDMDMNNDGLDSSVDPMHWSNNWTVIDAVGLSASQEIEDSEFARLYAKVNFFADFAGAPLPPNWVPRIEPGADHEVLLYEFEYAGRWGNSTGQTESDWHVSNITDNFGSGYINNTFLLRQSGDPHPVSDNDHTTPPPQPAVIESNQGVPYGTILTGSIGGPNYLKGDYNKNGEVDAADYVIWRKTKGQTGSEFVLGPPPMPLVPNHPPADGDHTFLVDDADYAVWASHFGQPGSGGGPGAGATLGSSSLTHVPEPVSFVLAAASLLAAAIWRNRPRFCAPSWVERSRSKPYTGGSSTVCQYQPDRVGE